MRTLLVVVIIAIVMAGIVVMTPNIGIKEPPGNIAYTVRCGYGVGITQPDVALQDCSLRLSEITLGHDPTCRVTPIVQGGQTVAYTVSCK